MTEQIINYLDFWEKYHKQIEPTVIALDRSLESLDSECFEDNSSVDLKQSIANTDKEFNVKTVKNEVIEQELRYACDKCNFRSHDKLPISIHQMIDHGDEAYRTIGIGCEACEDGELHTNCDFTKHTQTQHKTEKKAIKQLEYSKYTSTASESKDDKQFLEKVIQKNMKLNITTANESEDDTTLLKKKPTQTLTLNVTTSSESKDDMPILKKEAQKKIKQNIITSNYDCQICNFKGQKSRQPLILHMKTEHKNDALFQCDSC